MRVVAFSDLPEAKEVSFREVGVGNMKIQMKKTKNEQDIKTATIIQEELEREGNESIF